MQIKASIRRQFIPVRMAMIIKKETKKPNVARMRRKGDS
jgi:hypothetical protein